MCSCRRDSGKGNEKSVESKKEEAHTEKLELLLLEESKGRRVHWEEGERKEREDQEGRRECRESRKILHD